MLTLRFLLFTIGLAGVLASHAQQTAISSVQITGAVKQPLTLTAEDLRKMPRAMAKTSIHGVEATYEGVHLHDILHAAGAVNGSQLRGKALSSYVLAEGEDGYQALFSLAELDPAIAGSEVLLADTANGSPLSGAQGRFRLIAPKDKIGARSVRMLVKLEIVQLRKQPS